MRASWDEPSWLYSTDLLGYHLRRPDVDGELLIGLEDAATGELVSFYAFLPVSARIGGRTARGVFGSFLTSARSVQGSGAARAVQVHLLALAERKGFDAYFAFCEVGAVSQHSIVRACASVGLTTEVVTTVGYHAAPGVSRRRRPNTFTRPYTSADEPIVLRMLRTEGGAGELSLRYADEGYRHRWSSPLGTSFVFERDGRVDGFVHLARFDVRDGGRTFSNVYVQDFVAGDLTTADLSDFLGAALLQIESEGCKLVLAPAIGGLTEPLLAETGFRKTPRRLNLLATPLHADSSAPSGLDRFSLDVF